MSTSIAAHTTHEAVIRTLLKELDNEKFEEAIQNCLDSMKPATGNDPAKQALKVRGLMERAYLTFRQLQAFTGNRAGNTELVPEENRDQEQDDRHEVQDSHRDRDEGFAQDQTQDQIVVQGSPSIEVILRTEIEGTVPTILAVPISGPEDTDLHATSGSYIKREFPSVSDGTRAPDCGLPFQPSIAQAAVAQMEVDNNEESVYFGEERSMAGNNTNSNHHGTGDTTESVFISR
ncbi:hypothetical protein Sste5346_001460 [Sporothrix stenoceras]|uniref:Uncharacterized protein n=1 Tax=Sporothrix stenoceras TaxID=5173 RepID=A0ABR3ZSJ6_9PEZI